MLDICPKMRYYFSLRHRCDGPVRRLPPCNATSPVPRRATGARSEDFCMSMQLTNSMLHHSPCDFVTYLSWYIACFHTGEG
jgi:hypothetical protein